MRKPHYATQLVTACLLLLLAPIASAQSTGGVPPQDVRIEAGDLADALQQYIRLTDVQLIYRLEQVRGLRTEGSEGADTHDDVVTQLLRGTGLTVSRDPSGAMAIVAPRPAAEATIADPAERYAGIEEVIVTGQKREERMQDVPIAISAFSMDTLDAQKIEGGFDLLKAVPNVTFSKTNFTGYNFQIRGIGTQAISATTDPGVAVSFNNTTLIVNRLFEQEYLDIERVEVLRGPQGTLYGRNATAGVINVISAKPVMGVTEGEFKIEVGNYNSERFRGHVNWAFSDTIAARAAFATTKRDGFGTNLAYHDPEIQDFTRRFDRDPIESNIDNRDLWTGRFSLGWQPNDRFRANLIYERFEENDRRMRSTKQLCHRHDGNVTLYDMDGNAMPVRDVIQMASDDYSRTHREVVIRTRYLSQLNRGCLPGDLFAKGDVLSADPAAHGAYGTPDSNSMPFIRALRNTQFSVGPDTQGAGQLIAQPPAYPDCTETFASLITDCIMDAMETPHGQSREIRDIFSLINPRYEALSELWELSMDYELSDALTLSMQSVWTSNDLFSTQDFLRFKTQPMFNDSSQSAANASPTAEHYLMSVARRRASPGGVVHHPQLGASDRFLMQDISQSETTQFSQELRVTSNHSGPINFSVGANYTRFKNTADYFVFINSLRAMAQAGSRVYANPVFEVDGKPFGVGIISCGHYYTDLWIEPTTGGQMADCIHLQEGSIDEARSNPQGHDFFLSRNPFDLKSAGLFGELYVNITDQLKLTAGLRMNWDRKAFTPVPSQTMLADWRGRVRGPAWIFTYDLLPEDTMYSVCHPNSPTKADYGFVHQAPCALAGMSGKGYPSLPPIVQEWRVPTGRIGLDWKADLGLNWVDETLLYAFYTRGYKAGGANPPTQAPPSGLLLEAAQGASAPKVFEAEYVNAFEIGSKNTLLGGALSLNMSAFFYDYKDYQVSKILDRTAVNENFDARIWGLELESLFAPTQDTLINVAIGYLRTSIADGERSLDLMDRPQGGHHVFRTGIPNPDYDVNWAPGPGESYGLNTPDQQYLAFDQWVVVRPTMTQASSCIAPAALVYESVYYYAGPTAGRITDDALSMYCPGGRLLGDPNFPNGFEDYQAFRDAPNGSAGFFADLGGNELPNAPRFTFSAGIQHTYWIPGTSWSATGRVDYYWQDKSYHRVYNTGYDRLQDWSNVNTSIWLNNERHGLTLELYVKNIFDETPITGAFLNSDDTGLTTNVFTLDPRLVGISLRKVF